MLGAIIGDIVGSRWEFNPTNDYNFEWLSDENGFTDDTICTVAVADAILHNSEDFGKYIHEWCNRYPNPMGSYGGRFALWVRSDHPQPYNSFGNGSAMRVSPVAWAAIDLEFKYLLDVAEKSAACTHNHPEGIKGAQTVALAIQYGIELPCYHPNFTQEHVKELVETCARRAGYNINIRKEDVINRFDETCQGTVPVALWIIGESTSFEDAVRKAVSLGADADTLGAIVGSIAEAIWGIPEEMRQNALEYLPSDMKSVVLHFYRQYIRDVKLLSTNNLIEFSQKYIDYFSNDFGRDSSSYYRFFESQDFPDACISLGFEMDCGQSFIAAYGEEAWRSLAKLSAIIEKIDDVNLIGSALFSQWRYFNHWSYSDATDEDREWFLILFKRLNDLAKTKKKS